MLKINTRLYCVAFIGRFHWNNTTRIFILERRGDESSVRQLIPVHSVSEILAGYSGFSVYIFILHEDICPVYPARVARKSWVRCLEITCEGLPREQTLYGE